jgi:hypothetical protein
MGQICTRCCIACFGHRKAAPCRCASSQISPFDSQSTKIDCLDRVSGACRPLHEVILWLDHAAVAWAGFSRGPEGSFGQNLRSAQNLYVTSLISSLLRPEARRLQFRLSRWAFPKQRLTEVVGSLRHGAATPVGFTGDVYAARVALIWLASKCHLHRTIALNAALLNRSCRGKALLNAA